MSNRPTSNDDWHQLKRADRCGVCQPRAPVDDDHLEIARLSISSLYLLRNQRFAGYCLLFFDAYHATSLAGLSHSDYGRFMADLRRSAAALETALHPDHMNIECLGNRNPHLHWHLVPRYRGDPRWGYPIWESRPPDAADPYVVSLTDIEYAALIDRIRIALRD
jgi:ATP adenylyltransferase